MNLRTDCLRLIPLTSAEVEQVYQTKIPPLVNPAAVQELIRRLCLSHERLRAELEGAEKLLADQRTPDDRLY